MVDAHIRSAECNAEATIKSDIRTAWWTAALMRYPRKRRLPKLKQLLDKVNVKRR